MLGNQKAKRVGGIMAGLIGVGTLFNAAPIHAEERSAQAHLLFVLADKEVEGYDDLAKCERLTIDKYKELGTKVTAVSPEDLRAWLKSDGKPYIKGHRNMQLYNMAKAKGAHAYGGLTSMNVGPEMASNFEVKEGLYFYPWSVSLTGCTNRFFFDLKTGAEVRAIPLKLGDEDDPWSLTRRIEPREESKPGILGTLTEAFNPMRGRPFLGIRTDGNKITSITKESPAKLAGMQIGDLLLKLNGREIADLGDVIAALKNEKPGHEVEVVFEHEEKSITTRVALADYHELVNVKLSPIGKPLAELKAVDVQGRDVRLDQLKDKVVMLDFWATWCEPCKDEMPVVQAVWEKYKDRGLEWVGVSVDTDDAQRIWKAFVERNGLGGIQFRSPEWGEAMNVSGYPTILLVDRKGIVRFDARGGEIAESVLALLEEGDRPSQAPPATDSR